MVTWVFSCRSREEFFVTFPLSYGMQVHFTNPSEPAAIPEKKKRGASGRPKPRSSRKSTKRNKPQQQYQPLHDDADGSDASDEEGDVGGGSGAAAASAATGDDEKAN